MATGWTRYVAIGDSTTEGLEDHDGSGGYLGWADRLAAHLAHAYPHVEYANLAVRGKLAAQIQTEQVPAARDLAPDLITIVAGMNDVMVSPFDPAQVAKAVEEMFAEFAGLGATVLTFTLPDPTPNMPFGQRWRPRIAALNEELRDAAARTGAILVDLHAYPDASDPRFWAEDRLHGNTAGHIRVANALAHGLGLPGFDSSWRDPLPPAPQPSAADSALADLAWLRRHVLPWAWRTARGQSAGDGRSGKLPVPRKVRPTVS